MVTGSTHASHCVTQPIYARLVVGFWLCHRNIPSDFQKFPQYISNFPEFSRIKKLPEFSRFSRVISTQYDLDGTIVCNQLMFHVIVPQSALRWHHIHTTRSLYNEPTMTWMEPLCAISLCFMSSSHSPSSVRSFSRCWFTTYNITKPPRQQTTFPTLNKPVETHPMGTLHQSANI